ncbi:T9SS type A sorting domain-containing protein [Dyadobacter sp. CY261]|uniref:T9SS type A sorting domain-containing protein n=1 Tax=Dyadobacter sp. CY261 TaxID=2907203 RepID=UPI001F1BEF16|nr:T9SS type A sorting domain-containing protein [Dyadobacter sp. CY261]MCF0069691.1 T9SS type A sorting domain-containing protein [Dyadobacter sp. CY261]
MKHLSTLLLLLLLSRMSFSQCPQNGTFTSQAAIDDFAITYGNCSVLGRVGISGSDITNLNGLLGLKTVEILSIDISNMPIKDLTGLNNLTTITNGLGIQSTVGSQTFLESFNGLSSLTSIGDLRLFRLGPQFKTLSGLGNIQSFYYCIIDDCDGLTDLSGFESIDYIFRISVGDCDKLQSLNGLHNAYSIDGLYLNHNPSMTTMGLTGAHEIIELYVTETGMVNFDGLENLTKLASINISDNPSLESIAALKNVDFLPWDIRISSNPNLDGCTLPFLCNAFAQREYYLSGNKGSCSSRTALLAACELLPVTLAQFDVTNENGVNTLQWSTVSELNSEKFEIEYSSTGKSWKQLGTVASSGDSDSLKTYSFIHRTPEAGNNYYRLRMVDRDKTFAYSKIAHAYVYGKVAKVYPNPVSDRLELTLPDWDQVDLFQLIRTDGKIVFEAEQLPEKVIDVAKFTAGNYILKITDKDGSSAVHRISLVK